MIDISHQGNAQIIQNPETKSHTFITARYHYGIVVPHHTSMAYLIEDFSQGFELTYGKSTYGKDNWEKYFNYPEIGFGFYYGTFGNKDIYGDGYALFPYVNFNIYRTHRFDAHYKVSLGIGYATKPFRIDNNIYNSVFGSHLNAYVGFGLMLDYRIINKLSLSAAMSLNHMSNGGIKKPNNGINTATISIGTKYHFNDATILPSLKHQTPSDHSKEILITGFLGNNQGASFVSNTYWSGGISACHLWHNTVKRAFGLGIDLMYFGGAPYLYFQENEKASYGFRDHFYSGIFMAYHKYLGRTMMYLNLGAYIHQHLKPAQPIYPRVGIRYQITERLLGHFGIKANFFTAEYLEFGLGYRIPYKSN